MSIAPITEAMKPAGSPGSYQPTARPRYPATSAPAIPSRIVIRQPPGSRPGISSFATAPMIRPITIVPIRPCMTLLLAYRELAEFWLRVSQFDDLRASNVFACANVIEQVFTRRAIKIQNCESSAAGLISTQGHGGNVHTAIPEQRSNSAYHPGPIGVFKHKDNAAGPRLNWTAVHADNSGSCSKKCAAN